jgi:hypothetical protein
MNHLLQNWKTTAQSLLSGLIGLSAVAPALSFLTPKQAGCLVSAGVVAKVILGVFQKDAGSTLAVEPGDPTPQIVPSHEIPNSPTAVPIPNNGK